MIGLCAGSLAAAAISASRSVFELVPAAIEAVLVAFRTGLRSVEVGQDLEQNTEDISPSWSVILGIQEAQASQALRENAKATVSIDRLVSAAKADILGSASELTTIYKRREYK